MIKAYLVGPGTNDVVGSDRTAHGNSLFAQAPYYEHSVFKSATRAALGTSIVVQPTSGESIVLTDLIVTSEKVATATVTVRFTDGTNTINIFVASINDSPVNMGIPFAGKWQGWRDARIELVTSHNSDTTVSCGYYKVPSAYTMDFADWDALR